MPARVPGMIPEILNCLLGTAHEVGELGIEACCGLEERRVTGALIDRELGAGDHSRRVFGEKSPYARVCVYRALPSLTRCSPTVCGRLDPRDKARRLPHDGAARPRRGAADHAQRT